MATLLVLLASILSTSAAQSSLPSLPTPQYDEAEAKRFASLANAAYCEEEAKLLSWNCTACQLSETRLTPSKIVVIDDGWRNGTRVIVGRLDEQLGCIISFRGSHNLADWVHDLELYPKHPTDFLSNCSGCKVHSGFYNVWKGVMQPILDALNGIGCTNRTTDRNNLLYITGHSLGAALTHMAMFDLKRYGWNIAKSYSFEAPRVGNQNFSDTFMQRFSDQLPVFRVTHFKDPVVHLPVHQIGLPNYVHVPREVYYDSDGKYKVCYGAEDKACADQHWDLATMLAFHTSDHCSTPLVPGGSICDTKC